MFKDQCHRNQYALADRENNKSCYTPKINKLITIEKWCITNMACLIELHKKNCQPKFPSHKIISFTLKNNYYETRQHGLYLFGKYLVPIKQCLQLELVLSQLTEKEVEYIHHKELKAEPIKVTIKPTDCTLTIVGVIISAYTLSDSQKSFNATLRIDVTQTTNNAPPVNLQDSFISNEPTRNKNVYKIEDLQGQLREFCLRKKTEVPSKSYKLSYT